MAAFSSIRPIQKNLQKTTKEVQEPRMNKQFFRVIFNKARGQLMAVAETAPSQHGGAQSGATTRSPRPCANPPPFASRHPVVPIRVWTPTPWTCQATNKLAEPVGPRLHSLLPHAPYCLHHSQLGSIASNRYRKRARMSTPLLTHMAHD